jgi:hypothetical protein
MGPKCFGFGEREGCILEDLHRVYLLNIPNLKIQNKTLEHCGFQIVGLEMQSIQ